MVATYTDDIFIQDFRFSLPKTDGNCAQIAVLFPLKYFGKDQIINLLNKCICNTVLISSIHETEFKKYKTTIESINLDIVSKIQRIIVITDTLLAYVFTREEQQFLFSLRATHNYIVADYKNKISVSYLSFRLWKRVYDSEQLWSILARFNAMGYINAEVKWNDRSLRGYLDFSQLCLVPECRNLCIEQLIGFQLYYDQIYFRSLDRFTDEICELANHSMDNSKNGTVFWIGSVYVSGTSEQKVSNGTHSEESVYYFFKHADSSAALRKIYTIFEWATQAFRVDSWFNPQLFENKTYSRVGNSSFIAVSGSNYWTTRHYTHWERQYCLNQAETYQLLQKQFGARPLF